MKKGKDFWGPPTWVVIHVILACFTTENKRHIIEFLWLLTRLLPCEVCRVNLKNKLISHPPEKYLVDRESAFFYGYLVHDLANQHINEATHTTTHISPPYDTVKNYYFSELETKGVLFWGSFVWAVIHIFAATMEYAQSKYYHRFLVVLSHIMPDKASRDSLKAFMASYPIEPYLRSNHDIFTYTYVLHDHVNKKLGKSSPPLATIKTYYFRGVGEECSDCKV
jgi:hypothetical protein